MNRRSFLGAAGAATVMASVARRARAQTPPPGAKLCHACIGVGGMMGGVDLNNFISHPRLQVVALCDVDKNNLAAAAEKVQGARTYVDWRELLAKEGDAVDSVSVSTPDHMHAPITVSALRARKHVYCQKPLCHDVAEAIAMMREAEKSGCVTQLGTQYASMVGDRMAVQYLREGVLGEIKRIILFQTSAPDRTAPRPARGSPAPPHLMWDFWLGTAPARDYAPHIYHPCMWRVWQDFGTGRMGDNQSHLFDSSWKGVGLTAPLAVKAEVDERWKTDAALRADVWPQGRHVTWTFPGNPKTGGKPITVEWFDGEMKLPDECYKYAKDIGRDAPPEFGSLVIGSEGAMLMEHGTAPRLISDGRLDNYPRPKLPDHPSHYHHYVDACLGEAKTASHFRQSGPMSVAILLGNCAVRFPDTELQWDAASMKITNVPEANKLIGRKYREGWNILGLG
ncbi:MAG TPA: Gfo/Idh/MocA family oxidoreductase [Kiritimatiellia bacterium]|nr:Gfo/Idh/MocA family oxidoreductase [Kiritimatiellia bacterium]